MLFIKDNNFIRKKLHLPMSYENAIMSKGI